jgi:class 3 adenylate cyclase
VRKLHETLHPYAAEDRERTLAALPVLARLLVGQPLTEEYWEPGKRSAITHAWRPVLVRGVNPGDTVRVKSDAYGPLEQGGAHNGRIGKVVALRGGVVVAYDDVRGSTSMGVRHPPEKLEVQVPIRRRPETQGK